MIQKQILCLLQAEAENKDDPATVSQLMFEKLLISDISWKFVCLVLMKDDLEKPTEIWRTFYIYINFQTQESPSSEEIPSTYLKKRCFLKKDLS